MPGDKSLFPITDSGRPAAKETHDGFFNGRDLDRTATARLPTGTPLQEKEIQANAGINSALRRAAELAAPSYQSAPRVNDAAESSEPTKAEREVTEKPSLVYVRSIPRHEAILVTKKYPVFQRRTLAWDWRRERDCEHAWNQLQAPRCERRCSQ